ncbi:MAG: hypothetical protein NVS3B25_25170 [Hymenobacter sp.]
MANKVYVVTQFQFTEGNFGDLESLPCRLIGVYTTPELAQQAVAAVEIGVFAAQYGNGAEKCQVRQVYLDTL